MFGNGGVDRHGGSLPKKREKNGDLGVGRGRHGSFGPVKGYDGDDYAMEETAGYDDVYTCCARTWLVLFEFDLGVANVP